MSKVRLDFVTNSSSTCFTITNKSDKDLTLVDFVKENEFLLQQFLEEYDWYKDDERFTQDNMIECAERRDETFYANSVQDADYGDEDGDTLGHVYDYILRDGGESENFRWRFKEYWR